MAEEKEQIQRLMVAKCSLGSMDYQYLNLDKDHGVYFQDTDHPLMNAVDHVGETHILQFGRCSSPVNPKNIASGFLGFVNPIAMLANAAKKAMGCEGCKCSPKTLKVWENTDEGNCLDGAGGLLNSSKAHCFYGGEIVITKEPEAEKSDDTEEESTPQEGKKSVTERMPSAVAEKVKSLNGSSDGAALAGAAGVGAGIAAGIGAGIGAGSGAPGGAGTGIGAGSGASGIAAGVSGKLSSGMEQGLLRDTASWYEANANGFEQLYGVSDAVSRFNYANNMRQAIPLECLNPEGLICDLKGLSAFRMGGGSAAAIGQACAASYNILKQLGEKPSMSDIILAAERQQTVKGIMDQGPMAVSMASTRDYMKTLGFETKIQSPEMYLKSLPSTQPSGSCALLGASLGGAAAFHTLQTAPDGRLCCAENKAFSAEALLSEKAKQPMLVMEVCKPKKKEPAAAVMHAGKGGLS